MVSEPLGFPMDSDSQNKRASELIEGARCGDAAATDELLSLIYPELKRRARWLMTGERAGHTFGPSGSELVQRVMERILGTGGQIFHAANTEEDLINMLTRRMRFILVDYARAATAHGKPSPRSRAPLEDIQRRKSVSAIDQEKLLIIHEILAQLGAKDAEAARALELRSFSGLTNEEAAAAMGLSVATFRRAMKRASIFVNAVMK